MPRLVGWVRSAELDFLVPLTGYRQPYGKAVICFARGETVPLYNRTHSHPNMVAQDLVFQQGDVEIRLTGVWTTADDRVEVADVEGNRYYHCNVATQSETPNG